MLASSWFPTGDWFAKGLNSRETSATDVELIGVGIDFVPSSVDLFPTVVDLVSPCVDLVSTGVDLLATGVGPVGKGADLVATEQIYWHWLQTSPHLHPSV